MLVQNYIIRVRVLFLTLTLVWSYREKEHQRKRTSDKDSTVAQDSRSGQPKLSLEIGLFSVKVLLSASAQSDRTEGHIATGKTSAADISDSCLSKQKMLPHLGQQHTLTTSITSEINEPPLFWTFAQALPHCQQLQLCPFKHFPCRFNNLSLLFHCCFCCFVKKENLEANDG